MGKVWKTGQAEEGDNSRSLEKGGDVLPDHDLFVRLQQKQRTSKEDAFVHDAESET